MCLGINHSCPADEVNQPLHDAAGRGRPVAAKLASQPASAMATAGKNTLEQYLECSLNKKIKSERECVMDLEEHQSLWRASRPLLIGD